MKRNEDKLLDLYMRDMKQYPRLLPEDEKTLSKIILMGKNDKKTERATHKLVTSNLALSLSWANRYYKQFYTLNISLMDLIAAANLGLVRAAKTYNYEKGRFGTYASTIIIHAIIDTIEENRLIHIPRGYFSLQGQINKIQERYGYDISNRLLAKKMNISEDYLRLIQNHSADKIVSMEDMNLFMENADSDKYNFNDTHGETTSIIEAISDKQLVEYILQKVKDLPAKHQRIFNEKIFGNLTCKEIGINNNVTRQRVDQILLGTIRYLKEAIKNDIDNKTLKNNTWKRPSKETIPEREQRMINKRINGIKKSEGKRCCRNYHVRKSASFVQKLLTGKEKEITNEKKLEKTDI